MSSPNNVFCAAVESIGGPASMAQRLEVTSTAVKQWMTGERPLPVERCADVERITAGRYSCEALRPDKRAFFEGLRGTKPTPEAA